MTIQELFVTIHHGRGHSRPPIHPTERSLSERDCTIVVFCGVGLWLAVMIAGLLTFV